MGVSVARMFLVWMLTAPKYYPSWSGQDMVTHLSPIFHRPHRCFLLPPLCVHDPVKVVKLFRANMLKLCQGIISILSSAWILGTFLGSLCVPLSHAKEYPHTLCIQICHIIILKLITALDASGDHKLFTTSRERKALPIVERIDIK